MENAYTHVLFLVLIFKSIELSSQANPPPNRMHSSYEYFSGRPSFLDKSHAPGGNSSPTYSLVMHSPATYSPMRPPSIELNRLILQKTSFPPIDRTIFLVGAKVRKTYRRTPARENEILPAISSFSGNILGVLDHEDIVRGIYNSNRRRVIIDKTTGKIKLIGKEEINQIYVGRKLAQQCIEVPGIYILPKITD